MRDTLSSPPGGSEPILFGSIMAEGRYPAARKLIRAEAVRATVKERPNNLVLLAPPLDVDPTETLLPQAYRSTLSQLRSGYCSRLASYRHSVGWTESPTCPKCRAVDQSVTHLFSCPEAPTDLAPADLWTAPLQVAQFLYTHPTLSALPPFLP